MSPRSVIVVSSINQDITLTLSDFPAAGETVLATSATTSLGGKGANVAVAAAKTSAALSVHMVGAVGRDGAAEVRALQSLGVDTSLVSVVDAPTGKAFVLLEACGQNRIIAASGANAAVTADACEPLFEAFGNAVVVLQLEIGHAVSQRVAVEAADAGAIVVFNPSPAPAAGSDLLRADAPVWRHVHVIVVNEVEACQLSGVAVRTGATDELVTDCAAAMDGLRGRCRDDVKMVVTAGSRGVVYSERGGHAAHVEALKVRQVVDTTGAGDTFTGFLAGRMARGDRFEECVRFAVGAGGVCVERSGAADSIPTAAEVEARLAEL